MSVETLRYCDLCGSTVHMEAAQLAVPMRPEEITPELHLHAGRVGGRLVRWYDVCAGCLDPMLANVRQHQERVRVDLERRRLQQLHEQGNRWIGGGSSLIAEA